MIQVRRWVRGTLPLVALLAGCSDDAATADAGGADAGGAPTDTPTAMDVGGDAGEAVDAGAGNDTGAGSDTGAGNDAGGGQDAGADAGAVDAGVADAGCSPAQPCPGAQTCCAGACVDVQTSLAHCGGCGVTCAAASGTPACVAGRCTVTACPGGTASCDDMAANGCETDTATSLAHCGGCGRACSFANAAATCAAGACALGACATGFGDCDATAANGCEVDTRVTVAHCGACGAACATPNATPACAAGSCAVGTCNDGFANCDAAAANGCEVDLRTSAANCGMCGRACGAGQSCGAGQCQYGTGADGALTATADQQVTTVRASAAGAAGSTTVTVSNVAGVFAAGQSVLLHQTQAAVGSVGHYEYARVAAVSGATLTLAAPLRSAYVTDATSRAQVVRVLEYTAVTVNAGATVTAPAWDGNSGGIMAFDATGRVTVAGALDVTGRGFRGNRRTCMVTPTYRCMRGVAGESERGRGAANLLPNQSGGGGGGAGQDCGGGGGGGHATPGEPGSVGSAGGTCAEAHPVPRGEGGGTSGAASLATAALFGGAGGEGGADEDGSFPGGGGHGGGVILVRASSVLLMGDGEINASGGEGESGHQSDCGGTGAGMGGGGGGAGGAVRLTALVSATLLQATADPGPGVRARGGGGGFCGATAREYAAGEGGNGRVAVVSPMVVGASFPAHMTD